MSTAQHSTDVVIIGGGAAGLWAAPRLARAGLDVLVLEKTGKLGTKILASGGSRCNLTTTLPVARAAALYGPEAAAFIKPALKAMPPVKVRAHFEALGVPTKEEPALEKVFPASDRAKDVRDALAADLDAAGVRVWFDCRVQSLARAADAADGTPRWCVHTPSGDVEARAVLLAAGGKSYPGSGTTGDAYPWLKALGHTLVDPVPALVPLRSPEPWVHALSGLAVDGEVRLGARRRTRPTLFTHRGLSGPGPMDVSEHVARTPGESTLRIDLVQDETQDALRTRLLAAGPGQKLAHLVHLPGRLLEHVATVSGFDVGTPLEAVSKKAKNRLVEHLKGLPVTVDGTLGFAKAEVTAGGIARGDVNRKTMALKAHPGLYVAGELLDVQGPIGGLNFQAAFATATLAADAIRRALQA